MLSKEFYYDYKGERFLVHIDFKSTRQKMNYYRLKDGVIFVSANGKTSIQSIEKGLESVLPKLLKRDTNSKFFTENGVYIFGDFVSTEDGFVNYNGIRFLFLNKENFYKQLKKFAKPFFESRVKYYSEIMGVKTNYKVSLKKVETRYGSNSLTTKTLSFNLILLHYSQEIIDSVVIHELAHDFVRNHSKDFYDVVYRYCPNYDYLDKKLKLGILK